MITGHLEKLILSGKATYKTFVAGGTEKTILNVFNDRYIIITDITYFSSLNHLRGIEIDSAEIVALQKALNTQLRIFSEKSFNTFLFRNNFSITETGVLGSFFIFPSGSVHHNVYLVHESDVAFTFSYAGQTTDVNRNFTDPKTIGYAPPLDYGKEGQAGVETVRIIGKPIASSSGLDLQVLGGESLQRLVPNQATVTQFSFPVDLANKYIYLNNSVSYPILQVGYVEILGNLTNISASY